jgi:2-methylisocitrate lyase-like PEP mutase family enzyme
MSTQTPYPFQFAPVKAAESHRGAIPSVQAAKLRGLVNEAASNPETILAVALSCDTLSSKLVEQAAFPAIFLSGFNVAASLGLPDTGYIAFQEMAQRIQETVREVKIPIIADADTGYGSPMNVRRTVQGYVYSL